MRLHNFLHLLNFFFLLRHYSFNLWLSLARCSSENILALFGLFFGLSFDESFTSAIFILNTSPFPVTASLMPHFYRSSQTCVIHVLSWKLIILFYYPSSSNSFKLPIGITTSFIYLGRDFFIRHFIHILVCSRIECKLVYPDTFLALGFP